MVRRFAIPPIIFRSRPKSCLGALGMDSREPVQSVQRHATKYIRGIPSRPGLPGGQVYGRGL